MSKSTGIAVVEFKMASAMHKKSIVGREDT